MRRRVAQRARRRSRCRGSCARRDRRGEGAYGSSTLAMRSASGVGARPRAQPEKRTTSSGRASSRPARGVRRRRGGGRRGAVRVAEHGDEADRSPSSSGVAARRRTGAASRDGEHQADGLAPAELRLAARALAHVDRDLDDVKAGLAQTKERLDLGRPARVRHAEDRHCATGSRRTSRWSRRGTGGRAPLSSPAAGQTFPAACSATARSGRPRSRRRSRTASRPRRRPRLSARARAAERARRPDAGRRRRRGRRTRSRASSA